MNRRVQRLLPYLIGSGALLLLLLASHRLDPAEAGNVHNFLDGVATTLALIAAAFFLVFHRMTEHKTARWIGVGLLVTGLLDLTHTLTVAGFIQWSTPREWAEPLTHQVARGTLAAYLLTGQFVGGELAPRRRLSFLTTAIVVAVGIALGLGTWLPRSSTPEVDKTIDLVVGLAFAAVLFSYVRQGRWRHSILSHWLVISLILATAGQIVGAFALGSADTANLMSHLLLIGSYLGLLIGIAIRAGQLKVTADRAMSELGATADRLTAANASLARFAYTASHDLMEPLRKIRAFGDLLVSSAAEKLDPTETDYLIRMTGGAERLQQLLNAILNLSRSESNDLRQADVPLRRVVDEILDDLEPSLSYNAKVEVGPLPLVWADETQMRQLFQNLICNALKFHKPESPATVFIGQRGTANHSVIVVVSDDGIGFDPALADKMFAPFERLHPRLAYEGTGIGLAICDTIVRRHGGTIEIESSPGNGATFAVTLPGVAHND